MQNFRLNESESGTELSSERADVKVQFIIDENSNLKDQLQKLHSQFDSAVSISKELEKLHAENLKLAAKFRAARLAHDDLERRFQLNTASYESKLAEQSKWYELKIDYV
jgi:predicted RNase H-like nuclease (RuvC/YqgF family)